MIASPEASRADVNRWHSRLHGDWSREKVMLLDMMQTDEACDLECVDRSDNC